MGQRCFWPRFNLYPSSFWTGEDFIPYRSTLLTTLPQYFSPHQSITKLQISMLFPRHHTQSNTLRITQRDLVNGVTAIVRTNEGVEVEVIFQSPETDWSQLRCLAPFWGLKGHKWRVRVIDGERGEVDYGRFRIRDETTGGVRRMRNDRELYWWIDWDENRCD